jgi:hypothetical protein
MDPRFPLAHLYLGLSYEQQRKFADAIAEFQRGLELGENPMMLASLIHAYPAAPQRGPRPPIPIRTSITQYTEGELMRLLRWIASDGQLRTDDQIVDEMVSTLGFSRRGIRIKRAILNAITGMRPRG